MGQTAADSSKLAPQPSSQHPTNWVNKRASLRAKMVVVEPERSYWFSKSKSKWPFTFDLMASVGVGIGTCEGAFSQSPSNTARGLIKANINITSTRLGVGNLYAPLRGRHNVDFGWMIDLEYLKTVSGKITEHYYKEGYEGYSFSLEPFYDGANFYGDDRSLVKDILSHGTTVEGNSVIGNIKVGARVHVSGVTLCPYMGIGAGSGFNSFYHCYSYRFKDDSQKSGRAVYKLGMFAFSYRVGCAVNVFRYFYIDPYYGGSGFGGSYRYMQSAFHIHLGARIPLADW